jgi:phospholipid-binding lipoprotein MlaA
MTPISVDLPTPPARAGVGTLAPSRLMAMAAMAAMAFLVGCATTQEGVDSAPTPGVAGPPDIEQAAVATAPAPEADRPPARDWSDGDPLEAFNRSMYEFNDWFDYYVGKPVAKGYRAVLPTPVRRSFSNFFNNLREPIVIVNDLLQAKFAQAASDTGRFVTNTLVGILGLFDPASHIGMPRHDEDFGQTFGLWGVGDGPYLVLPFLGPRNLRDTVGWVGDWYLWAPNLVEAVSTGERNTLVVVNFVDTRAALLDATDILEMAAGQDPYVFVREAYRQRRQHLIHDGKVPRKDDIESLLFEDAAPAPEPEPLAPAPP